jgi:hypothetical protein
MKWIRRHRPSPGTAFGALALMVALGGVAFAAIPDSTGTIHACYQKNNGNLRVVESAGACRNGEVPIEWNQRGDPGPPGPPGPGGTGAHELAYDSQASEVSTASSTPVDFGGPSVTVTVPQNAIVRAYIEVQSRTDKDLSATCTGPLKNPSALVWVHEPTDLPDGYAVAGTQQNSYPGPIQYPASQLLPLPATPGLRTYSLRYARSPDASQAEGCRAFFRDRHLWIEVLKPT